MDGPRNDCWGSVLSYQINICEKSKKYTSFEVIWSDFKRTYRVYRLYQDFRVLYVYLTHAFTDVKFKLPPRRIFGNSFDEEFLNRRCSGLHHFVEELCAQAPLGLFYDNFVKNFFTSNTWQYPVEKRSISGKALPISVATCTNSSQSSDEHNMHSLSQSSDSSSNSTSSASSLIRSVLRRTMSFFSNSSKSHIYDESMACLAPVENDILGDVSAPFQNTRSNSYESFCTSRSNICRKLNIHDFEILKTIGKGSFGRVFLASFKHDKKLYAVKVISKDQIKEEADYRHIMSERDILTQDLDHPFLVKLKCTFQTESKLYIVMQYVNGGEIFFHLQREIRFPEMRAKFYAAEIVSAFEYLHHRGIVYRDLKPENILLDAEGHVVLVDFGLAKEILQKSASGTATFCGTPEYLAPEIILNRQYGKAVDWWCLGAVLYEMLFGLPPFYSSNRADIFDKVLYEDLSFTKNQISPEAEDFIRKLLRRNPCLRLGSGTMGSSNIRSHPFFAVVDWDKIYSKRYQTPFQPTLRSPYGLDNFDPQFLRESISYSIYNEPNELTDETDTESSSSSQSSSSSSDADLQDGGHPSFTSSYTTSTYHSCRNVNFSSFIKNPNDRRLLFSGYSYADTIELN